MANYQEVQKYLFFCLISVLIRDVENVSTYLYDSKYLIIFHLMGLIQ